MIGDKLVIEQHHTDRAADLLHFADFRVFIDRDYHQALEARKRRARDKWEPFIQEVLEREHQIISQHKALADVVVLPDFGGIQLQEPAQ